MIKQIFTLAIFCALCFGFEKDGDVLVLTDATIDDAIKDHEFILVEFYAPWCGHCKHLQPEYSKAATTLQEQGSKVALAKVDATEETESAQKFEVSGYPTLKWFVNGAESEYSGGRTAAEIVNWVTKKTGPPCHDLTEASQLASLKEKNDIVVVAFLEKGSSEFTAYENAARGMDDAVFAVVHSADAVSSFDSEATFSSVVLYKNFDEGRVAFTGNFETSELTTFVQANSVPLVAVFSTESAPKIFGSGVETHFLYFNDESAEGHQEIVAQLKTVAADYKGKTLFVVVPHTEERVLSYFDFKKTDLPKAILVSMGAGDMKKFAFTAEINAQNVRAHVAAFHSGELKPTLKSEDAPADNSGPVKVVVGTTFNEIVLDTTKDVLVEFYAPWCGHCKSLTPIYESLGKKFQGSKTVTIAKVDATANDIDHPAVNVRGFPTIIFFPANNKNSPITYDGERELDAMVEFIEDNATAQAEDDAAEGGHQDL